MKKRLANLLAWSSVAACMALSAGCASVAIGDDTIAQGTARTLGLASGSFVIGQRVDQGRTASYTVMVNTGKQYDCRMRAVLSVSAAGRGVSDPVCTEIGKAAKPAADATTPGSAGS